MRFSLQPWTSKLSADVFGLPFASVVLTWRHADRDSNSDSDSDWNCCWVFHLPQSLEKDHGTLVKPTRGTLGLAFATIVLVSRVIWTRACSQHTLDCTITSHIIYIYILYYITHIHTIHASVAWTSDSVTINNLHTSRSFRHMPRTLPAACLPLSCVLVPRHGRLLPHT